MNTKCWSWLAVVGLCLGGGVPTSSGAGAGGQMSLRVVDKDGCSRTLEIRADGSFASGDLASGSYTVWWGASPASSRRGLEHGVARITLWHHVRVSGAVGLPEGSTVVAEAPKDLRLTKELDVEAPLLSTKLGVLEVPAGGDGIVGRLEFSTVEGRRLPMEEWAAVPVPVGAASGQP